MYVNDYSFFVTSVNEYSFVYESRLGYKNTAV